MSYYNITISSSISNTILPYLLINGTYYNGPYNTIFNGTFNSASGLLMESVPVGNQKGYGMLANSTSSVTTSFNNTYSPAGLRFLLEPNNPFQNSAISISTTNVTITNITCSFGDTTNSIIYYSPLYISNGPVSYENWPEQYQQQYTLVFPDAHELVSGNLRIQAVLVDGLDGAGSVINENRQKNITLSNQNIENFCINNCGYIGPQTSVMNVSGTLKIPLYLSGMTNSSSNTVILSIPFSYNVNVVNGFYQWPSNKPTAIIRVLFDRSHLYTHRMQIQGRTTIYQDWNNLNLIGQSPYGTPIDGWTVDLRIINDLLMFNRTSSYSLMTFLYPQTSTSSTLDVNQSIVLNVNYIIPLSTL